MEEKTARYYQDKETLEKHNKYNGIFTEKDLSTLNILPENYILWKEEYDKKEYIKRIRNLIESWVNNWDKDRAEVLVELKNVAREENSMYTETELKEWISDEVKKLRKKISKEEEKSESIEDSDLQNVELKEGSFIKQYLELMKDKKFGEASELLVKIILNTFKLYTTKDDLKTEVWIYKQGIYVPQGKSEIKEFLRQTLGKFYSNFIFNLVMNKLEPDTFIDIDKFFNQNYPSEIPVNNGILDVYTKQLKPFTKDKIFFNKIPVDYIPGLECPQIDKFLSEILANKDDRLVFYELGGFVLLKEYKFEKAFTFIGNGRNGKDKSLELIKRIIGIENCCSVPLSSLSPDSFVISEFFGKMANIAGELNNQDLKDTSMFKALTGRSIISGQRKFLRPVTFQNYAKFIFACNELPMIYDNSKGFWDRWVLLEFPYTFVPEEEYNESIDKTNLKIRDPDIIDKITTPEELSGLLNKFLEGLDRLMKQKNFSTTKGSEEIKNLWIRKSNSFMAFCLDRLEHDYGSYITKKDLRKVYIEYCKNYKIIPKSDFAIKKTLEELFGSSDGHRNVALNMSERVWEGIKFKKITTLTGLNPILTPLAEVCISPIELNTV